MLQFPNTTARTSPRLSLSRCWPRRSLGWIGIDAGTAMTKLAQVKREGNGYRIVGRHILSTESGQPSLTSAGKVFDFDQMLPQLKLARTLFRGRRAAAVLPTCLTTFRHLELPPGTREELRRMVGEELRAEQGAENRDSCFDFWEANGDNRNGNVNRVAVLEVEKEIPLQLSECLAAAQLECEILDGLPCALARAAVLSDPEAAQSPTAILDLGHSSAVLVIAKAGRPIFTRLLRDCGLHHFTDNLSTHLQLSATGARHLLSRVGIPCPNDGRETDSPATAIHHLLSGPLERLIAEISRSLSYVRDFHKTIWPTRLTLCGGGACIRNLSDQLAAETGLATGNWALYSDGGRLPEPDDAQFAVAVALSTLAWEKSPCT